MASRSWNNQVLEEEASCPIDSVENPGMVVEENTAASPEHSGENFPDDSGNVNADSSESHIDAEPVAAAKPHTVLQDD